MNERDKIKISRIYLVNRTNRKVGQKPLAWLPIELYKIGYILEVL